MKKSFFLALPIILLLSSCSNDDNVFGSGRLISETRNVENFSKVKSEGVFEVSITQGNSQSVEITADDNIIARVKTTVVDNELRLFLKNDGYHHLTLKAKITVLNLNGLTNSGTGSMNVKQIAENGHFKVVNSGTGDIRIDGNANRLSVYNEGTGHFRGFEFIVKDGDVENLGSGTVEVNCSDNLKVDIEGSGDVFYKGSPVLEVKIKGSGSVVKVN